MAVIEDVAPALLEQLQKEFADGVQNSQKVQKLLKQINDGKATYIQAEELAAETGTVLSQTFGNCLSSSVLPDGKMYYNIAQRVVEPMLREDHEMIAQATEQVQAALNKKAGIGLKPQTVAADEDRIYGIINKISEAEHFDDVAWVLGDPVVNFSQSVVDRFLQKNVEFQGKTGLRPKVVRTATRRCCKWCKTLAGEYEYPMVPNDVYRRHENCGCIVEYDPIKGKRQNVHTKQFTESIDTAKMEARKVLGIRTNGVVIHEVGTHVFDQMAARNVTMDAILDAIMNPLEIKPVKYDAEGRPSFAVIGRKATVTINPETGKLTTTYPTHTKTVNKLLKKKGML